MAELSEPNRASRPLGHRLLRWLIFTVGAIVAIALIAALAVQTPWARGFVERKVTQLLAQQNITFENEGFCYNVFGLRGDLRNVRIFSPNLEGAPPFLELDRARFNLGT